MKVTISDVAKLAGVSTATVSHTINNTRYVSNETKERRSTGPSRSWDTHRTLPPAVSARERKRSSALLCPISPINSSQP